jgi:Cu/Ag efflux protein CusF
MFARNTVRGLAVAAVLAASAASGAQAQQLPPARQLVDKYVEAIGGRQALARHQQRKVVSEMSMPAMGMNMTVELYQARPNKLFTKTEMAGMGTFTSGYDGTVAWTSNPMQGPRILADRELAETLRQAEFDNYDLAKVFPTLETTGEKTVAGRPCWVVKGVSQQGIEVNYCFDKETGLALGATATQPGQMGDMQVEMVFSDYQSYDGLKMPAKTTMTMMGQEMTTTIKSVSHAPFDASIFAIPAEVRALQTAPQN